MSNASDAREELRAKQAQGITCAKIIGLLQAIAAWLYGERKKEKKDHGR